MNAAHQYRLKKMAEAIDAGREVAVALRGEHEAAHVKSFTTVGGHTVVAELVEEGYQAVFAPEDITVILIRCTSHPTTTND